MSNEVAVADLEDFETEVPAIPIKPIVWSVEKYEVAQLLAISGKGMQAISEITKVPITAIKRWNKMPEFRQYIDNFTLEAVGAMKAQRLRYYAKMIDARVSKIEELGDYSMLSTKDTLDILEAQRKETEKSDDKEQTQYMKTIEALLIKSAGTQKQIEV